jgi:hypothetical protein
MKNITNVHKYNFLIQINFIEKGEYQIKTPNGQTKSFRDRWDAQLFAHSILMDVPEENKRFRHESNERFYD